MRKIGSIFIAAMIMTGVAMGEVRETRLDNGLRVLLKRIQGMPLVSVWSWIHAGSANEYPGITGAAHWCEHMNFKGTEHYTREDLKNLLEREGGAWNGYTWLDQTSYYGTLPSDALDLALDIEAERIHASLFAPEAVDSERTVILSELQMGENDPENLLDIETTAAAFKAHPYQWPTIGWQSDIQAMTRDDLYGFYRKYYSPNNVTLVVAGDFDEEAALEKIKEKFGSIPAGRPIGKLHTREPEQLGERRVTVVRGGETSYLEVLYHTPTIDSEQFFPLLVLDTLLGGGESINLSSVDWRGQASKSSRLYKGLVDAKIAAKAGALYLPTKYPNAFCVYATAAPGVSLPRLEAETLKIIEEVKKGGISEEEFQKVINQLMARFVYDTESITGQAHLLGFFDTLDNYRFGGLFLEKVKEVKIADVIAAARGYLTEKNRTVGWYVPGPKDKPLAADVQKHNGPAAKYREEADRKRQRVSVVPSWLTGRKSVTPLKTQRIRLNASRVVLDNGLTVIIRENHASPSLVAYADISAGSACDPAGKAGLANFTIKLLDRGTKGMSATLIAEAIDASGTELALSSDRDRSAVVARMLKDKLPLVMEIMAQMLREAVFPEAEIEKTRGQIITALKEAENDTQQMAVDTVYEMIYPPGHPYRHRVRGEIMEIKGIARADIADFYRSYCVPQRSTLVFAGDIAADEVIALVKKFFGDWKKGPDVAAPTVLTPPLSAVAKTEKARISDKTQVDIAFGFRGIARDNPDYYALQVMNTTLGRFGMGGRLGRVIREDMGLAYYAFSSFTPYFHVGTFLTRAGVNPTNVDKAVVEIGKIIRGVKEKGVTDEELEESKAYIIKSVPRQLETNAAVAAALADINFYSLGLDYFERFPDLIGKVTASDVRRVAAEYLHPDQASVVLAGPVP